MTGYIVNEQGESLAGSITFFDANGDRMGTQALPVGGAELLSQYVNAAANFVVTSPGHYDVGAPVSAMLEENEFVVVAKPSPVKYIILGAIAFYAITQLKK